jgi:hypothetical protein
MPRTSSNIEINNFVSGLITEATPLNFPPNASLDEQNFVLNRDGSRTRRPGMDLEPGGAQVITSSVPVPGVGSTVAHNCFRWNNVGGIGSLTYIVVQIGNELNFYNNANIPLSINGAPDYQYLYPTTYASQRFSMTAVDGMLVVTTGQKSIDIFRYDTVAGLGHSTQILYIRDMFGVMDIAVSN